MLGGTGTAAGVLGSPSLPLWIDAVPTEALLVVGLFLVAGLYRAVPAVLVWRTPVVPLREVAAREGETVAVEGTARVLDGTVERPPADQPCLGYQRVVMQRGTRARWSRGRTESEGCPFLLESGDATVVVDATDAEFHASNARVEVSHGFSRKHVISYVEPGSPVFVRGRVARRTEATAAAPPETGVAIGDGSTISPFVVAQGTRREALRQLSKRPLVLVGVAVVLAVAARFFFA